MTFDPWCGECLRHYRSQGHAANCPDADRSYDSRAKVARQRDVIRRAQDRAVGREGGGPLASTTPALRAGERGLTLPTHTEDEVHRGQHDSICGMCETIRRRELKALLPDMPMAVSE